VRVAYTATERRSSTCGAGTATRAARRGRRARSSRAFDEPVDAAVVADLDRLAGVMARQRPAWPAGERQAYHAITLGFYESELVRRVDPARRTLGRLFADEIARPLGADFHIGLPASIPESRLAALEPPTRREQVRNLKLLFGFTLAAARKRSVLHRALIANPGTGFYLDAHHRPVRDIEVPSGNGVGNARGIARAYGVFAAGGRELGLRPETLADPDRGIGYAYVTSRMGLHLEGDPRDLALRAALPP
jgi:hypothetical protein